MVRAEAHAWPRLGLGVVATATLAARRLAQRHATTIEVFAMMSLLAVNLFLDQLLHIDVVLFNIIGDSYDVARSFADCVAQLFTLVCALQMIRIKLTRDLVKVVF